MYPKASELVIPVRLVSDMVPTVGLQSTEVAD